MSFLANKQKRKIFITTSVIVLILVLLISFCAIYLNDYYPADMEAIQAVASASEVECRVNEYGIVFEPDGATKGFIFYPGGKVEHRAYIPLMGACAEQGILCVLVEMPFRLAVLDSNAADGIQTQYPEIEEWYIGGHSLGGSMAASYIAKHTEDYEGLILLGAYSTADLAQSELDVLSIYGSEDRVMNPGKYDDYKSNLPHDFTEIVIEGGCHAYFGMYGEQDGDGVPAITNREQITIAGQKIVDFMQEI